MNQFQWTFCITKSFVKIRIFFLHTVWKHLIFNDRYTILIIVLNPLKEVSSIYSGSQTFNYINTDAKWQKFNKSLSRFSHIWNLLQCVHCQVLDVCVSVGGQRTTEWPAQDSCWHNEASKQASVSPTERQTHSDQANSLPFFLIVSFKLGFCKWSDWRQ